MAFKEDHFGLCFVVLVFYMQWDTADAEIKARSVENPELTNGLPFKASKRSSPTARIFFLSDPFIHLRLSKFSPSCGPALSHK